MKILLANNFFGHISNFIGGADKTIDTNNTTIHEQFRNFWNSADILIPVFFWKAQVVVDAASNIIAIQHLRQVSSFVQSHFKVLGDGSFPGSW